MDVLLQRARECLRGRGGRANSGSTSTGNYSNAGLQEMKINCAMQYIRVY